ncbi:MAG: hypothetical protein K2N23_06705 [Clostridia bacterium]|nr:hypothetical protein [Clostridia bacterium]
MKLIKKSVVAIIAVFALLLSFALCACTDESEVNIIENGRNESYVSRYNVSDVTCIYPHWGVDLICEFENATVEMSNYSDKAMIVFYKDDKIQNCENFSYYKGGEADDYGKYFKALHKDLPLKYEGRQYFYWMPVNGWSSENEVIDDYITFTAKVGKNIVGYAVLYVHAVGENGNGTVLADMEFPKIDGEYQKVSPKTVDKKIKEVIEEHENLVKDRGDEAGVFYTVTEAYEKGFLNLEQIKSIAYYQNGGTAMNEETMGENYSPLSIEYPSEETEKAIKNSFYNSDLWKPYENYYTVYDIYNMYLGVCGNTIALHIGVRGESSNDIVWEEKIEGITLNYSNGSRILVFVK